MEKNMWMRHGTNSAAGNGTFLGGSSDRKKVPLPAVLRE